VRTLPLKRRFGGEGGEGDKKGGNRRCGNGINRVDSYGGFYLFLRAKYGGAVKIFKNKNKGRIAGKKKGVGEG